MNTWIMYVYHIVIYEIVYFTTSKVQFPRRVTFNQPFMSNQLFRGLHLAVFVKLRKIATNVKKNSWNVRNLVNKIREKMTHREDWTVHSCWTENIETRTEITQLLNFEIYVYILKKEVTNCNIKAVIIVYVCF